MPADRPTSRTATRHARAPPGGRGASLQNQLQRLNEASSTMHRDRLFKLDPEWAASSDESPHGFMRGLALSKRDQGLVLGRFGKRLVKVYELCSAGRNLARVLQIRRV